MAPPSCLTAAAATAGAAAGSSITATTTNKRGASGRTGATPNLKKANAAALTTPGMSRFDSRGPAARTRLSLRSPPDPAVAAAMVAEAALQVFDEGENATRRIASGLDSMEAIENRTRAHAEDEKLARKEEHGKRKKEEERRKEMEKKMTAEDGKREEEEQKRRNEEGKRVQATAMYEEMKRLAEKQEAMVEGEEKKRRADVRVRKEEAVERQREQDRFRNGEVAAYERRVANDDKLALERREEDAEARAKSEKTSRAARLADERRAKRELEATGANQVGVIHREVIDGQRTLRTTVEQQELRACRGVREEENASRVAFNAHARETEARVHARIEDHKDEATEAVAGAVANGAHILLHVTGAAVHEAVEYVTDAAAGGTHLLLHAGGAVVHAIEERLIVDRRERTEHMEAQRATREADERAQELLRQEEQAQRAAFKEEVVEAAVAAAYTAAAAVLAAAQPAPAAAGDAIGLQNPAHPPPPPPAAAAVEAPDEAVAPGAPLALLPPPPPPPAAAAAAAVAQDAPDQAAADDNRAQGGDDDAADDPRAATFQHIDREIGELGRLPNFTAQKRALIGCVKRRLHVDNKNYNMSELVRFFEYRGGSVASRDLLPHGLALAFTPDPLPDDVHAAHLIVDPTAEDGYRVVLMLKTEEAAAAAVEHGRHAEFDVFPFEFVRMPPPSRPSAFGRTKCFLVEFTTNAITATIRGVLAALGATKVLPEADDSGRALTCFFYGPDAARATSVAASLLSGLILNGNVCTVSWAPPLPAIAADD